MKKTIVLLLFGALAARSFGQTPVFGKSAPATTLSRREVTNAMTDSGSVNQIPNFKAVTQTAYDIARRVAGDPTSTDVVPFTNVTTLTYALTADRIRKFGSIDITSLSYNILVDGKPIIANGEYVSGNPSSLQFQFGSTPITGVLNVFPGIGHAAAPVDLTGYSTRAIADQLYQPIGSYLTASYTGFDQKYLKTISGSFADLRALTGAVAGMIYQPTDHSAGPAFYYDPSDTTTPDDGGTVIVCADGKRLKRFYTGDANILWFGNSLQDGSVDNSSVISGAIASVHNLYVPANITIYLNSPVVISNLNNWSITCSQGATLTGYDLEKNLIRVTGCNNFKIEGGNWTRVNAPAANSQTGTDGASSILLKNCTNYIVQYANIYRSAEMGICQSSCAYGQILKNVIHDCFRDGIYADYSANMLYADNSVSNIKDDALSLHDYGIASQRTFIAGLGYQQAGYSIVRNNRVDHAYEGFSSLQCTNLIVEGNIISNTVNCGINISNNPAYEAGGTAVFSHIKITGNTLENTNKSTVIMGTTYPNIGQNSGARGAIFVGTQVPDAQGDNSVFIATAIRGLDVIISGNQVNQSGGNAYTLNYIDRLSFSDNQSLNCNSENVMVAGYPMGQINEFRNCNDVIIGGGNTVVDTRAVKLHAVGAYFYNTTGQDNRWIIKGFSSSAKLYDGAAQPDSVLIKTRLSQFVNDLPARGTTSGYHFAISADVGAYGSGTTVSFPHHLSGVSASSIIVGNPRDAGSPASQYYLGCSIDATTITLSFSTAITYNSPISFDFQITP